MATQAMSNALYFSTGSCAEEEFHHYGLALDKYTHFTSPIRRYSDIVVHRLLMAAISKDKKTEIKDNLFSNKDLEELCRHINNRNRVRGDFKFSYPSSLLLREYQLYYVVERSAIYSSALNSALFSPMK